MGLKDVWKDLENATSTTEGDDITAKPINLIANAVIEIEKQLPSFPNYEKLNASLNLKVDKEEGKTLSSNDYTDEEKTKLSALPTNEELSKKLNLKVPIIDVPMRYNDEIEMDEKVPIDEICDGLRTAGVYYIYQHIFNGMGYEDIHTYRLVVEEDDSIFQYLEDCILGVVTSRNGFGWMGGEWSEWEIINDTYSKAEIDNKFGDVEAALDELHNYAQSLISGGEA